VPEGGVGREKRQSPPAAAAAAAEPAAAAAAAEPPDAAAAAAAPPAAAAAAEDAPVHIARHDHFLPDPLGQSVCMLAAFPMQYEVTY
jgi:hypothetical protein